MWASSVVPLEHILIFSAAMFAIGAYGVMARRNAVLVFMAVELMLNAVAINLVAFAMRLDPQNFSGVVFAVFVITVAAAELELGLAIVLRVYRMRTSVNLDGVDAVRW